MHNPKEYLSDLIVGGEITSPGIDKVLKAMDDYGRYLWYRACQKCREQIVALDGQLPEGYTTPNFENFTKPNTENETRND